MKLLFSTLETEHEFIRLLRHYSAFKWATAWAGIDSSVFAELCRQEAKINQLVVGIHFYQTHPDFIEKFLSNKKVKYIKQPEGTFHPKFYFFYNSDSDWELIIGSANFTKHAFSKNTEACILLTSNDPNSKVIFRQSMLLIESCWRNAKTFDRTELDNYRIMWEIQKPKIKSLSGKLNNSFVVPFHQIPFMVMRWSQFIDKIRSKHNHTLKNRLNMLRLARNLFVSKPHFSDFTLEERSFIAGIPFDYGTPGFLDWGCFGSMKGAGTYKKQINQNNKEISTALDEIPLFGEVTEEHFNKYKDVFSKVFQGNSIASFSRLLTMKRPDIFYCITSANKKNFCEGFKITYSHVTYDTYWELIVLKIINSEWWLHPNPRSLKESQICEARAAFLDAFCYIS